MNYKYIDYFPMASKNGITGAYDFLIREGFGEQVDWIKQVGYNTNARRLMVAGLICDNNLLHEFLSRVWIQGDTAYRIDCMDRWYQRYDKRVDLQNEMSKFGAWR